MIVHNGWSDRSRGSSGPPRRHSGGLHIRTPSFRAPSSTALKRVDQVPTTPVAQQPGTLAESRRLRPLRQLKSPGWSWCCPRRRRLRAVTRRPGACRRLGSPGPAPPSSRPPSEPCGPGHLSAHADGGHPSARGIGVLVVTYPTESSGMPVRRTACTPVRRTARTAATRTARPRVIHRSVHQGRGSGGRRRPPPCPGRSRLPGDPPTGWEGCPQARRSVSGRQ